MREPNSCTAATVMPSPTIVGEILLRFFDNVEGWVPHWTESGIAGRFDRIDQL
ncbi:hypothetical protein [Vreelandella sp. EE22]